MLHLKLIFIKFYQIKQEATRNVNVTADGIKALLVLLKMTSYGKKYGCASIAKYKGL